MGKSGNLSHLEPEGPKLIQVHSNSLEWFTNIGWDAIYFKFKGSENGVARAFTKKFDGSVARVGDLTIQVSKKFIVESTRLLVDRE